MGKRKAKETMPIEENNTPVEPFVNDDDDDDDDDLPPPFTPSTKENEEFKTGDLIFAQYPRYPYWPAVFYTYMQKKKQRKQRAYVYFFDDVSKLTDNRKSRKKVIPIYISKIKRFACCERNELIKKGSCTKEYLQGMEQAEEYMRKRALGKITTFFEYVLEETHVSDDEEKEESPEEKTPQISEEERIIQNAKIARKALFNTSTENTEMANNVFTWIKNNSRPLLNNITNGKITSQRHHTFHHGTQKDKDKLRWYSGFGELSETSANEILDLLVAWFTEDFPGSDYRAVSYVADVWLPEAYIHALSQIKNILLEDAEKEYLN